MRAAVTRWGCRCRHELEVIVFPLRCRTRGTVLPQARVGGRTSRRQAQACSSSRRMAPRAHSNSERTSLRPRPVGSENLPDRLDIAAAVMRWSPPASTWVRSFTSPSPGPDPERGTYRSLASFQRSRRNTWLLQEITTRMSGRIDSGVMSSLRKRLGERFSSY